MVYLPLEIHVSYLLLDRIPDFYESGVSSSRTIPRYQYSTAWLHQGNGFLLAGCETLAALDRIEQKLFIFFLWS